jgi:hypothetical protein
MIKKLLLASSLVFISSSANADAYKFTDLKAYVTKNGSCLMAIATTLAPSANEKEKIWSNKVICVTELSAGEGTIKSYRGCALAVFNVETGKLFTTYDSHFDNWIKKHPSGFVMASKSCNDGGLDELLKMKAGTNWGTVKDALTKGEYLGNDWKAANGWGYPKIKFLYAAGDGWESFWNDIAPKEKNSEPLKSDNANCVPSKGGMKCQKTQKN